MEGCGLCPRNCGADRSRQLGFCGAGAHVKVARASLHLWEEPCISGTIGSGTVFFSGCSLQCCFCQNFPISAQNYGKEISIERLSEIFLELQGKGAHNINLVNPTHYVPWIIRALNLIGPRLSIPVVYNSGGYENVDTLRMLEGYVDVYLPDIKYKNAQMSAAYSSAPDYFDAASKAVLEMHRQTGKVILDDEGLMQKGLLIRHLVLPEGFLDSIAILEWIKENLPSDEILVSVMNQYTPVYRSAEFEKINRPLTSHEYKKVTARAQKLGLIGYIQDAGTEKQEYIPPFDLEGI